MSNNPFHSQAASSTTVLPSLSTRSPSPPSPVLEPPSPTTMHAASSPASPGTRSSASPHTGNAATTERIDEDLPPAYTPSADPTLGESTVELGPRRPFQDPPHLPSTSASAITPSQAQQHRPQWYQPPGHAYHSSSTSQSPGWRPQVHQSPASWQSPSPFGFSRQGGSGGGLLGALFDTVRDVVDAVSGAHDERMMAAQQPNAGAYPVSYNSPSGPRQDLYTPPRAIPPAPSQTPGPAPSGSPPHSPANSIPDDGRPTTTPVPGHPLLRDGNLLVYPQSYLCAKCRNTGYKNHDPSHPCRKCWDKYGKPYTGALTYTTWSSPDSRSSRLQRPLPKFIPPHMATTNGSSSSRYLTPPPQHPLSQQRHGRSVSNPNLHLQTYLQPSSPSYYVTNPILGMGLTPPVPHAIAVSPGDPVLGGRLCTRCGGSGMRPFLLVDVKVCEVCGGVGRVWR